MIVFSTLIYYLQATLEPTRVERLTVPLSKGGLQLCPQILDKVATIDNENALAYYDKFLIGAVKCFTVQATVIDHRLQYKYNIS